MIHALILLSLVSTCFATCADNCARAVAATRNTGRYTDCPSFMIDTVTPATAATTTTYTPTVYSILGGGSKKKRVPEKAKRDAAAVGPRQVTVDPTAIPTYATAACTAPSMFSSACQCLGYTATTTTVPAPWHTITATTTTTITVCDPANNYGLVWTGGQASFGANVPEYDGVTGQQCCALCFQSSAHCVLYSYSGGDCFIWEETGGQGGQAVPYCPYGTDTVSNAVATTGTTGQLYGMGPCGTAVPA